MASPSSICSWELDGESVSYTGGPSSVRIRSSDDRLLPGGVSYVSFRESREPRRRSVPCRLRLLPLCLLLNDSALPEIPDAMLKLEPNPSSLEAEDRLLWGGVLSCDARLLLGGVS